MLQMSFLTEHTLMPLYVGVIFLLISGELITVH